MGSDLSKLFVDVETIPHNFGGFVQLLFLMGVYGYVLMSSSNLISEGSELLLLIPSLAGIVGSIVLPVLGAVPDGAIVLFSGLGPNAQEQLSVGVGALAGSTSMLLTLPWCISIFAGRVNVEGGACKYTKPKLVPPGNKSLRGTGVEATAAVARGGKILLATAIPYLIIQGPAFFYHCGKKDGKDCHGEGEKYWALGGLVVCMLMFIAYLYDQVMQSKSEAMRDRIDAVRKMAIHNSIMSLSGVFAAAGFDDISGTDSTHLLADMKKHKRLRAVLKSFFRKYDRDSNGTIDASELRSLLHDLGENPTQREFDVLMQEMDTDNSGEIDFEEFFNAMIKTVEQHSRVKTGRMSLAQPVDKFELDSINAAPGAHVDNGHGGAGAGHGMGGGEDGDEDEEEEEEEEVPDDLAHLTPEQQQTRIKLRSAWMMTVGTLVVLVFSDAAVDVLAEFGNRTGIPAFYCSFVLAPLASNASELIASASYAAKKTKKTISISFATLLGAGIMNNTFCLGIFLALIFFKNLIWEFSAECIGILFVELVMSAYAFKKVQTTFDAIIIGMIFPVSIGVVAALEAAGLN